MTPTMLNWCSTVGVMDSSRKPDLTNPSAEHFQYHTAICGGVGWVWLAGRYYTQDIIHSNTVIKRSTQHSVDMSKFNCTIEHTKTVLLARVS